jgi:MoaA/NifB/PqqE/SkfB family radical SAM enzyme
MTSTSLIHTVRRYRTLQSDVISALPIVILMPHSACNCRCVMCDIWKDNHHLRQLNVENLRGLLDSFRKWGTRQVVMSGGEALLNSHFFEFCEILAQEQIEISLLTTGILLKKHASRLAQMVGDIIVSLDGDPPTHDHIRNMPGAFAKLQEGIQRLHAVNPAFPVSGRSVIHRLNYRVWPRIIDTARDLGLSSISFLPADVSSHAFNRETLWDESRQHEILPCEDELPAIQSVIDELKEQYASYFDNHFIAESREKIQQIHEFYAAWYGLNSFPFKRCNAPWVSTVVEADGTVRPCFFHRALGNIHQHTLPEILNGPEAVAFRKGLDLQSDSICQKCVCSLHLGPRTNPARR